MGFLDRLTGRRPAPLEVSTWFDQSWYEAESGETFADQAAAIEHYRRVGARLDASPHPLFEPTYVEASGSTPFDAYLAGPPDRDSRSHPATLDGLVAVGELEVDTELNLLVWEGWDGRASRWGDVADVWRRVAVERQERRRLDVPGDLKELPSDHHLDVPATPPVDASTLISIVMPTWNRPELTLTAIESVRAQTWEHWELLVVDDGSTDGTVAAVRSIADTDPRVRLIERPHEGVCAARNAALDAATGGYVAFLDSDNTWLPHFLHDMVATMADRDLPAAYGTLQADGKHGKVWRCRPTSPELIRVKNQIDMNVLVVRSDVMTQVGGFDPTLRRAVDWDLAIRIVDLVPTTHLPIVGVLYDDREESADRITVREASTWPHVVRQRHNIDWDAERARERDADLISVVLMLGSDVDTTMAQLEALEQDLTGRPYEVVLVDCAAPRHAVTRHASAVATGRPLRIVGYPRPMSWSFAADLGAAAARGDRLLVIDHGAMVQMHEVRRLIDPLEEADVVLPAGPGAQAFAIRSGAFFAVDGLDAMMHQTLEVADLVARLEATGRTSTVTDLEVSVFTPKSSVYEDQVVAEFTRRHGPPPT